MEQLSGARVLGLHAALVFVASGLLFFVQPMVAKFLLPGFGGGAAVWTVCLLFFQVGLFAGYAYAHALARLRRRLQVVVHVGGCVLVWAFLSVEPSAAWRASVGGDPVVEALLLLARHVGPPYLLLAATAPLIQRWFAWTHPGRSPYWLYAVSNVGSLLALLGYPFAAERVWARQEQAAAWALGFAVFTLLVLWAGRGLWRAPEPKRAPSSAARIAIRASWIVLPALSSALLLAVTERMAESVPSVPFLWVLPLALFLISYVVAFSRSAPAPRVLYPLNAALTLLLLLVLYRPALDFRLQLATHLSFLFVSCLSLHGELFRRRPEEDGLTSYYLALSGGGALGGLFVGLVAPRVFDSYIELPLLLLSGGLAALWTARHRPYLRLIGLGLLLLAAFLVFRGERNLADGRIHASRNFYGAQAVVHRAPGVPGEERIVFYNRRIEHGVQYLDEGLRVKPTSYYTPSSGIGTAIRSFPQDRPMEFGVIGLGAGVLATWGNTGDRMRMYEIDPKVIEMAEDVFTFLDESLADIEVVEGDGRLALESEPPQGFDLLVMDAFTGDAVPIHLLTVEAFAVYLEHVRPGGLIAVNATNEHIDILRVVARLADEIGLAGLWIGVDRGVDIVGFTSTWILLARDEADFGETLRARGEPLAPFADGGPAWTDERSSLFDFLR